MRSYWVTLVLGLTLAFAADAAQVGSHWFNDSVVITTGGTFQSLTLSASAPKSLLISNTNASDACYVDISGLASPTEAKSLKLTSSVPSVMLSGSLTPVDTVKVTCATTSDTLAVFDQ